MHMYLRQNSFAPKLARAASGTRLSTVRHAQLRHRHPLPCAYSAVRLYLRAAYECYPRGAWRLVVMPAAIALARQLHGPIAHDTCIDASAAAAPSLAPRQYRWSRPRTTRCTIS